MGGGGGGFTKNRYIRGELPKKVRLGEFADLGGAQQKKPVTQNCSEK